MRLIALLRERDRPLRSGGSALLGFLASMAAHQASLTAGHLPLPYSEPPSSTWKKMDIIHRFSGSIGGAPKLGLPLTMGNTIEPRGWYGSGTSGRSCVDLRGHVKGRGAVAALRLTSRTLLVKTKLSLRD